MTLSDIQKQLGTPYFETDDCLIYHGDCLTFMKNIVSEVIDLTVTSPPYNIGKEYEKPLPLTDYIDWCEKWIDEIYRITKPNGSFWLNIGYVELPGKAKALPIPYLLWNKTNFYM